MSNCNFKISEPKGDEDSGQKGTKDRKDTTNHTAGHRTLHSPLTKEKQSKPK